MTGCKRYHTLIENGPESAELSGLKDHISSCSRCYDECHRIHRIERLMADAFSPVTRAAEASERLVSIVATITAAPAEAQYPRVEPGRDEFEVVAARHPISKRRVAVYVAAAAIMLAVLVLLGRFGDSDYLCRQALGAAIENMRQMPWVHWTVTSTVRGEGAAEGWFCSRSSWWGQKRGDGTILAGNLEAGTEYRYGPEKGAIYFTAAVPGKTELVPATAFEMAEQMMDYLQAEAARTTIETVRQDGQEIKRIKAQMRRSSSLESIELSIVNGLLESLDVDYKDKGDSFSAVFDYPQDGPASIYELGAPGSAELVALEPTGDAAELIEKLGALRRTALTNYVAISAPDNPAELATSFSSGRVPAYFSARDNLISVIWRQGQDRRHMMGYVGPYAAGPVTPQSLAQNIEQLAESLVPVSITIYKGGEGRAYCYQLLDGQPVRYSQRVSDETYGWDLFVEKIAWPYIAVPRGAAARWRTQAVIGRDNEPLIVIERMLGESPTERWYLNPERGYSCQKNELLDTQGTVSALEVLEYDQTPGGQWYPAVIRKTWRAGGPTAAEQTTASTTRLVYLVENPVLPDELFDPDRLPEAESAD